MRRAAISLTNNIAEGHGRYHYQENIQFLRQARRSLKEILDDLNTCIDEQYFTAEEIIKFKGQGKDLIHIMNGYIAYLRRKKESSNKIKVTSH